MDLNTKKPNLKDVINRLIALLKQLKSDRNNFGDNFLNSLFELLLEMEIAIKIDQERKDPKMKHVYSLSIQEQGFVRISLELLVYFCILPNLSNGVGIPLQRRQKTLLEAYHVFEINPTILPSMTTLSKAMKILWTFFQEQHELRQILMAESFSDLIASLLEMIHLPETIQQLDPSSIAKFGEINFETAQQLSKESNSKLNEIISSLPIDQVFGGVSKMVAISAATPQVTPPAWYRRHCGEILSSLLIQPSGVLFTMERMLSISPERSVDVLQRFASLLEKIPQSIQKEVYWESVCGQLRKIFLNSAENNNGLTTNENVLKAMDQFSQCAAFAIGHLLSVQALNLESRLLKPLAEPLYLLRKSKKNDENNKNEINNNNNSDSLLKTLSFSIRCVEKLVEANELNPDFFFSLDSIIIPLFECYCFACESKSFLKASLEHILVQYFKWSESAQKTLLTILKGNEFNCDVIKFSLAESGEITVSIINQKNEAMTDSEIPRIFTSQIECAIDLLKQISNNTLIGDVFVDIMSDFSKLIETSPVQTTTTTTKTSTNVAHTQIINSNNNNNNKKIDTTSLMDIDEPQQQQPQPIIQFNLLQALVLMSDRLGPAVLTNVVQLCLLLKSLLLSQDEEIQTLCLSLLDQMLSGITKVKRVEEFVVFDLVPSLENIVDTSSEKTMVELASKLVEKITNRSTDWVLTEFEEAEQEEQLKFENEQQQQQQKKPMLNKSRSKQRKVKEDPQKLPSVPEILAELNDPLLPVRAHGLINLRKLVLSKNPVATKNLEKILGIFENQLNDEDDYVYGNAIQGLAALADIHSERIIPVLTKEFENEKRGELTRLKLGESLLFVARRCGQTLPKWAPLFMNAFLRSLRSSLASIKASTLSNLAQLCKMLRFALHPYIVEIISSVVSILQIEKDSEVRRGAVFLIHFLFRGLGLDVFQVLDIKQRNQLYDQLKIVYNSDLEDDVTKFHANEALKEYSRITEALFVPKNEKPKWLEIN